MKHCDDYIDDEAAPEVLRRYLTRARAPGHGLTSAEPFPELYADYDGKCVRVVMASRFGDVGITTILTDPLRYEARVAVEDLSGFRDTPDGRPKIMKRYFNIDDGGADYWLVATSIEQVKQMMEGMEFGDPSRPLAEAIDEDGGPLQIVEVSTERAGGVMCLDDEGKKRPLTAFEPGDWFCSEW